MALFALFVQFTLAFGHVHVEHANATALGAVGLAANGLGSPATPDQQHPADDICAICASVHMTGSAQAAASPDLPIPVTYSVIAISLSSETACDDLRCFELRSRGPPKA